MGRKNGKHCLKKYKKRDRTPDSTSSSSSSSLSEEEEDCRPFKTTQIFIGTPPPGMIAYPGTCSSGGLGDRTITQEEWCSKFCEDGQRKRTSQDQHPSKLHEEQDDLSNGKVIEDASSFQQTSTMAREEWCRQFCVAGHARRGGHGVSAPTHQHLQPHSSWGKSQGSPSPHQQPKVVCLPRVQCCGGCRGGVIKDGAKYKKPKGDEGPMTPAQQYMTFLQAYALAAAVMMGEPPRPRQLEHREQQQAESHSCRHCP